LKEIDRFVRKPAVAQAASQTDSAAGVPLKASEGREAGAFSAAHQMGLVCEGLCGIIKQRRKVAGLQNNHPTSFVHEIRYIPI
jgi:hypothetical protein